MTVHVSVRSTSALLLLSVSLLGLPADAFAQSVVAPQKAATLAERLDRLATEFDRIRIDLHVPGAVLAIVRCEEAIFDQRRERLRNVGFVVLTNTLSALPSIATQLCRSTWHERQRSLPSVRRGGTVFSLHRRRRPTANGP
jgi:hypothetical protein